MPKSFLVKRKCCRGQCDGEKPASSPKLEIETVNTSSTKGIDGIQNKKIPVIKYSSTKNERPENEQSNQSTERPFSYRYPIVDVSSPTEEVAVPSVTYEDLLWQRYFLCASELVRRNLCLRRDNDATPSYEPPPKSPSSSIESPLSPASCSSTDVTREEYEPPVTHRSYESYATSSSLRPTPYVEHDEDQIWQRCPSPVFPYFPCTLKRREETAETIPKHTCKDCGKSFMRASSLSNHKLIHKNVKAFHCDKCGMSFLRKSDLGKHIVTHTGVKPYVCDICYKRFSQSSNMLTHRRRHTGTRPYSCRQCGKSFYRKVDVRRHSRIHL